MAVRGTHPFTPEDERHSIGSGVLSAAAGTALSLPCAMYPAWQSSLLICYKARCSDQVGCDVAVCVAIKYRGAARGRHTEQDATHKMLPRQGRGPGQQGRTVLGKGGGAGRCITRRTGAVRAAARCIIAAGAAGWKGCGRGVTKWGREGAIKLEADAKNVRRSPAEGARPWARMHLHTTQQLAAGVGVQGCRRAGKETKGATKRRAGHATVWRGHSWGRSKDRVHSRRATSGRQASAGGATRG